MRTRSLAPMALLAALLLILSFPALAIEPVGPSDMIYFIMTDRFHDAAPNEAFVNKKDISSYHGGDLLGIMEKLDYIKSLGFTAIWITPVVDNQSGGYHGYWATDFYAVDEHLGTMDDLKALVDKAHGMGIKVIMDLVINHTGSLHPYVYDKPEWFHRRASIDDWNNQSQVENGWLAGLPDFDQSNPEVMAYLIDMAKFWIRETGIDGFRLDTVKHVQKEYLLAFTEAIKQEYPDFYLIGEIFDGRAPFIESYSQTGIDGFLDFPMYYGINNSIARDEGSIGLWNAVNAGRSYSNRQLMGTFLDNHDVQRFIHRLDDPVPKLKQALAVVMTYTGIPIVYYGTEVALPGGNDPDNRRDMVFEENEVTEAVRKLTAIRRDNPELVNGDIALINVGSGGFSYQRRLEGSSIVLLLNLREESREFTLNLPSPDGLASYEDIFESGQKGEIREGTIVLTAPARSALILKLR